MGAPPQIELVHRQLGLRIESIRKTLGLTQSDLAERSGFKRASIANMEIGRQRFLLQTVERIAEALGTSPKHLMKGIWT